MGILYPIYFCTVGTVLAVSPKIVPAVDCCSPLCTENNLLLISRLSVRLRGGNLLILLVMMWRVLDGRSSAHALPNYLNNNSVTPKSHIICTPVPSLTRVQTLISAYRAWKCPMLAHYPLILGSLSPIIVVQVATPGCHHLRGTGPASYGTLPVKW